MLAEQEANDSESTGDSPWGEGWEATAWAMTQVTCQRGQGQGEAAAAKGCSVSSGRGHQK